MLATEIRVRYSHLKLVTNILLIQHPSPTSMQPIVYGFSIGEDWHWDAAKNNCIQPYQCQICRGNCLGGKHVSIQLGSNDLLKRELPRFPFPQNRRSITLKWTRAYNIILQKFRYSGVREVLVLEIPNFPFQDGSDEERYILAPRTALQAGYFFCRNERQRVRVAMNNELRKMGEKFTNRTEIPLMCRMINFQNDRFLDNNIHLTYEAQKQRISAIRKIYKMY